MRTQRDSMHTQRDSMYMQKCLDLAERGRGRVEANPMVGCIVVNGGRIVGKGWHREFGQAHAEIHCLRNAGEKARGGVLYVSLEPCDHYGKTPPCTSAIIDAGIRRVVIGMRDPNPDVSGHGADRLIEAGIQVVLGVERQLCEQLNETWIVNVTKKRPFVSLKIAQTLDGFIAPAKGRSRWITSDESRRIVHELRAGSDAVLIGAETLRKDNPELTVRHVEGDNPWRIVLARKLDFSPKLKLFSDAEKARTIVITSRNAFRSQPMQTDMLRSLGIEVLPVTAIRDRQASLSAVLRLLFNRFNIRSVMVEGGAGIFSSFIKQRLTDRLDVFIAPKIIGAGSTAFSELTPMHISDSYIYSFASTALSGGDVHAILRPHQEQ